MLMLMLIKEDSRATDLDVTEITTLVELRIAFIDASDGLVWLAASGQRLPV
jgi:hypothetical protein